ncbi:MAG: hypothetical protein J6W45_09705 [Bacteroidales bacterium]|nr:hypothetical protein [Bacteroidales bacterium]
MQEKTRKIILIAMLAIAVIAGVFAVLFAANMPDKDNLTPDAYEQAMNSINPLFSTAAYILYIIILVAVVAILIFALWQLLKNFKDDRKKAIKTVLIIVVMLVVFLVSWLIARGDDVPAKLLAKAQMGEGGSKLVGAACISVYILFFASLLSIIYAEVSKLLKK